MVTPAIGTKRKKPPTFQHLPINRAKKLKREWVEIKKIKSQWRAQKRREGLVSKPALETTSHGDKESEDSAAGKDEDTEGDMETDNKSENRDDTGDEEEMNASDTNKDESDEDEVEEEDSSEEDLEHPPPKPNAKSANSFQRDGNSKHGGERSQKDDPDGRPSLRELTRQAYLPSSLHNYKSKRGSDSSRGTRGRGQSRGFGVDRGRGRGSTPRGRGRGQPDMRLRMNAMLEKIKRDFA